LKSLMEILLKSLMGILLKSLLRTCCGSVEDLLKIC
jgi:hypothetical protein